MRKASTPVRDALRRQQAKMDQLLQGRDKKFKDLVAAIKKLLDEWGRKP